MGRHASRLDTATDPCVSGHVKSDDAFAVLYIVASRWHWRTPPANNKSHTDSDPGRRKKIFRVCCRGKHALVYRYFSPPCRWPYRLPYSSIGSRLHCHRYRTQHPHGRFATTQNSPHLRPMAHPAFGSTLGRSSGFPVARWPPCHSLSLHRQRQPFSPTRKQQQQQQQQQQGRIIFGACMPSLWRCNAWQPVPVRVGSASHEWPAVSPVS